MIIKQGHAFWALASSGHSVLGEHANSPAPYSALNALLAWRDPQDAQRISGGTSCPASSREHCRKRVQKQSQDVGWIALG